MVTRNGSDKKSSSSRKVKSGCRTCKIRRVKCDEKWPICHRCQSTGRVCDGYGIWGGGSKAHGSSSEKVQRMRALTMITKPPAERPQPAMAMVTFERGEEEILQWFVHRSCVKLSGIFRAEYWSNLLLQASMTEPAIRHAILALSSAHREEVTGPGSSLMKIEDRQELFTVMQYNKAIKHLQPYLMASNSTSRQVTLFACIIFAQTEFLRGHYISGIVHLEAGSRLLQQIGYHTSNRDLAELGTDGWLITNFTRLMVQAKLFGQTSITWCRASLGLNLEFALKSFRSIHHARRNLEHIILRAFDLQDYHICRSYGADSWSAHDLLERRKYLQTALQIWSENCQITLRVLPPKTPWCERLAYRLLQLYYHLAYNLVETCLYLADESVHDQNETTFIAIVSHCMHIHELIFIDEKHRTDPYRDPEPSSPNSVSDSGWIAPLYHTAIRCRIHHVRHLAVKLLQTSSRKEGIWNSTLAAIIAKEVIRIEEGAFYSNMGVNHHETIMCPTEEELALPRLPAEFRLSRLKVSLPADRSDKLGLSGCRQSPDGQIEWIVREYSLQTNRWD